MFSLKVECGPPRPRARDAAPSPEAGPSSSQASPRAGAAAPAAAGAPPPRWAPLDVTDSVAFSAGNPRVEHVAGVVHLYRHAPVAPAAAGAAAPTAADEPGGLPEGRSPRLAILALPPDMGFAELCAFLGGHFAALKEVRLVRQGGGGGGAGAAAGAGGGATLVLLTFADQAAADAFFADANGVPFCALEPELRCHLVFVRGVELAPAGAPADALAPPPGAAELPACPVCLERLDAGVSGIVTTVCNHRFHGACLRQWGDASCPVCRFCQHGGGGAAAAGGGRGADALTGEPARCAACATAADLWICLICGHVGCGRYAGSHAAAHWSRSGHGYALELETQRVWAYAADAYVHRLVRSKAGGKLVEVPPPGGHARRARGECGGDACGGPARAGDHPEVEDDPEMEGALLASKLDAISWEYNQMLVAQLDSQRAHYEGANARELAEHDERAEAARAAAAAAEAAAAAADAARADAERGRRAAEGRAADAAARLAKAGEERDALRALNDALAAAAKELRARLAAAEAAAAAAAAEAADLREQVRDLMVFIEARGVVEAAGGGGELGGGTVLPVPPSELEARKARRAAKKGK